MMEGIKIGVLNVPILMHYSCVPAVVCSQVIVMLSSGHIW